MSTQTGPTLDEMRATLRKTEARLEGAKAKLQAHQRRLDGMGRIERRSKDGARFVAYVEGLRGTTEAITAMLDGIRFELGEGPEPTACPHTSPGPHGGRLPCQAGWGHPGLHVHVGQVRRRWE